MNLSSLVHLAEPEQIVVPSFAHEACAFEIQKQIGLRGFRQPAQSFARDYGESSHHGLPARALLQLDLRLLDDAVVGFLRATRRLERDRDWQGRGRGERCDALCDELCTLRRADARNERKVIVSSPLLVAAFPPAAHIAMFDRLRIAARQQRL